MVEADANMNEANPTMANADPPSIVTFNVGGVHHQVSRSLVESFPDTMLARLCSETWQNEEDRDTPIFIDRDGERFRLVLDFMRDNKVALPVSVPRETFLIEMRYYGFPNDEVTYVQNGIVKNANCVMKEVEETKILWAHMHIACVCFRSYAFVNREMIFDVALNKDPTFVFAIEILNRCYSDVLFKECLQKFGVSLKLLKYRSVDCLQGKLEIIE